MVGSARGAGAATGGRLGSALIAVAYVSPHDPPAPPTLQKRVSDRSFGLLLVAALLVATFFPLVRGRDARLWILPVVGVLLVVALVAPRVLSAPHRLWLLGARFVAAVLHPIVMGIVFFLTITPIAFVFRLAGRDALDRRLDPEALSYFSPRDVRPSEHMRNQF